MSKIVKNKKKRIYEDDVHMFDYRLKRVSNSCNQHIIYYPKNEEWAKEFQGKKCMVIEDNGNGLKIKRKSEFKGKDFLNYSEAVMLRVLLAIEQKGLKLEIENESNRTRI